MFGLTGPLQPDFAAYAGSGERHSAEVSRPALRRCVCAAQDAPFLYFLTLRHADLDSAGDLLCLHRLLAGGCRRGGCQHRDVIWADVGNRVYAGDPAAVSPSRGQVHAAGRDGGVVCALCLLCPWSERRGALPALSRHPAARRVLRLLFCRRLYLYRPRGGGEGQRPGAKHDSHVYLRHRDAAGIANFRRAV